MEEICEVHVTIVTGYGISIKKHELMRAAYMHMCIHAYAWDSSALKGICEVHVTIVTGCGISIQKHELMRVAYMHVCIHAYA